jgi:RNA polymerase sigma factor (sigma-70 family)
MASPEQVMPRAASALRANAEPDASGDDGLSAFIGVRPRLFGIAYRMLGSVAEAEDIVQDVWLRWQCVERSVIVNPAAYLATATTRLCINAAQCARARRETYPGTWLPEPVDTSADPGLGAERGEALNLAVLLLLEKLSPTERASYVLREAFDYSYCEIAEILRIEEANARQLVSRARQLSSMGVALPSVRPNNGVCSLFFSTRLAMETWLLWKVFSLRMLPLIQMAAGSCARRRSRFAVASALPGSLPHSLRTSGPV